MDFIDSPVTTARGNRECKKAREDHKKSGRDTYERGSLRRLPGENRPRTLNAKEWRGESRNEHDGAERTQGLGKTRAARDQYEHEPDTDSKSGHNIESDRRHDVPPNRQETFWRKDAGHTDDHEEESDEQGKRSHT